MKNNNNFWIGTVYDSGIYVSEFCNNYNCADAYTDKLIKENPHIKVTIKDPKNRIIKLHDTLSFLNANRG